ncbi:MAG TPA: ABC transporter permease [Solirubrobacteraceae bacterium]|nr:ABC transporter permease [Solirubrobacteraceae bacterium]
MTRRINLPGIAVVVILIALWQLVVDTKVIDFNYVSPPSQIADRIVDLARDGELSDNLWHTVSVALQAWVIAVGLGVIVGLLLAYSAAARTFTMASVDALRTVPVVALVPVALLVWGPSAKSEIVVAAYAALWPIVINTMGGLRSVNPRLHDVARTLRLSRVATARKIALPAAAPEILVGARLALGTSLVVTIVAEMVGNPAGLGYALIEQQQALNPAAMWAYVIVIGIVGVALNYAIVGIGRLLVPGSARRLGDAGA